MALAPPRIALVSTPAQVLSSYSAGGATGGPRSGLRSLSALPAGRLTPDAADALGRLSDAVLAAGGDLRVTDALRTVAEQVAARSRYDRWLAAGSPKPGTAGFDSKTMKADFVAKPGRSMHNAGRAVDLHTSVLAFPSVPADRQLDRLWELAIPLGWTPVIKTATEGASESWHFDFWGPWRPVRDRLGYETAAIAAALDVGQDEAFASVGSNGLARRIQAGLHRAGFDVGDIDGVLGRRSSAALLASGMPEALPLLTVIVAHVDRLRDSATIHWRG